MTPQPLLLVDTVFYLALGGVLLALTGFDFLCSGLSAGQGPVSRAAARAVYALVRGLARIGGRRTLASAVGPLCLTAAAATWLIGAWGAFALLFAAEGALVDPDGTRVSADEIVGHAGATLSTLGLDRVLPASGWWTSVGAVASLIGMVTITMGVSYLLNITQAVRAARRVAMRVNLAAAADAALTPERLESLADDLAGVAISFQAAPLAAFYGSRDALQSLPHALMRLDARLEKAASGPGWGEALRRLDAALARLQDGRGRPFEDHPRRNALAWARARTVPRPAGAARGPR